MPCNKPYTAYRSKDGKHKNGKHPIVFKPENGIPGSELKVACGQCYGCRLERSRLWAVRCMHESKMHENNHFLTLTYNDEHLKKIRPYNSLVKSHLQKFWKRLRKHGYKFRYFACGEYGEQTNRPHYHAIIFGAKISDRKFHTVSNGNRLYTSKKIENIWGKGHILLGDVSFESCAYVARYVVKKFKGKKFEKKSFYERIDPDTGECWNIEPEFQTCSRGKPGGIGSGFYEKYKSDMYQDGTDGQVILRGGISCKTPAFYDNKFEKESETNKLKLEKIKEERRKRIEENPQNYVQARLDTKEKIADKKANKLLPRKFLKE